METPKRRKRKGAQHTGEAKLRYLKEVYGDEADIEFDDKTGLAKINGESIYLTSPTRRLSLRHELVADLASIGMRPASIKRELAPGTNAANSGHYGRLLRDPRIRARATAGTEEVIAAAKAKLQSSVVTAAENIHNAVCAGDLKQSQYVLATQGITEKKETNSNVNVNMDFGSWLSSVSNTKEMHEIPAATIEPIDITNDVTELPAPTEGVRL